MNSFYKIDGLGKMEYLSNLSCFSSSESYKIGQYEIFIGINSLDEKLAQNLHPYIFLVLKDIKNLNQKAILKLRKLYNLNNDAFSEIIVNYIDFEINKNFNLLFNLPEGAPMEYLSVKFNINKEIIDSGGGNY